MRTSTYMTIINRHLFSRALESLEVTQRVSLLVEVKARKENIVTLCVMYMFSFWWNPLQLRTSSSWSLA